MGIKSNIWYDKKVLVTGHTGFKGSWLVYLLSELGAKVVGLSLPDIHTKKSLYLDAKIENKLVNEYLIDIRDENKVYNILNESKPDYVFHLAAQSLVLNSIKFPLETISTNVLGTMNILLASLNTKSVKGILISTTDKVYKNEGNRKRFIESDNLGGLEPYSGSKAAAEILISSIRNTQNSLNVPITTVRAGNVIGGGDWGQNRLVPDLINAFHNNATLKIRNPSSTRPWQFILDCLRGYLMIGETHLTIKKGIPESFNLGPNKSLSVEELIGIFEEVFNRKVFYEIESHNLFESTFLNLNSQSAKNFLGWTSLQSTKSSVKKTAHWYMKFLNGHEAGDLMRSDIYSFGLEKFYTIPNINLI